MFVNNFQKDQMIQYQDRSELVIITGMVISFIPSYWGKEIVRFYYDDIRDISQIKRITEYKVSPIIKN